MRLKNGQIGLIVPCRRPEEKIRDDVRRKIQLEIRKENSQGFILILIKYTRKRRDKLEIETLFRHTQ